jgi:hypothetical protein
MELCTALMVPTKDLVAVSFFFLLSLFFRLMLEPFFHFSNVDLTCALNEFKCLSGDECVRRDFLCDHDYDCRDGSDEDQNCSNLLFFIFWFF